MVGSNNEPPSIEKRQRIRVVALVGKMVIEPVRDAIWFALHGQEDREDTVGRD